MARKLILLITERIKTERNWVGEEQLSLNNADAMHRQSCSPNVYENIALKKMCWIKEFVKKWGST